jgi:thymidylate synthase
MYLDAFERIREFNPRNNRRGSYFQRLIDLGGDGKGPNQLEWILSEYKERPTGRRSKWQATTFDPARDLSSTARLEFPCLQQISFTFASKDALVLNVSYATQQIVHKGYGNYLGLCRLGAFMADEMDRKLDRVNVFVGVAKMDQIGKTNPNFQALLGVVRTELKAATASGLAA